MISVFSKEWFKKYNKQLVWLAKLPIIGEWIFCIKKYGFELDNKNILEIQPNAVVEDMKLRWTKCVKVKGQWIAYDCANKLHNKLVKKEYKEKLLHTRRTHYFVRNEFALRLQSVFYPIWITFHIWDLIADKYAPQLSFGFSTLTKNPGSIGTDNPVDGNFDNSEISTIAWSTIHNRTSAAAQHTNSNTWFAGWRNGASSSSYVALWRSVFCFDTSSLTSGATISATVLSLCGNAKYDTGTAQTPNIDIYTATPANTNDLVDEDYDQIGTTSQTGSPITYAGYSNSAYNDFTFDATGRGNVSKTGISKFGARNANYDVSNTEPTWSNSTYHGFAGNYSEFEKNKPKLVVTYSTSTAYTAEVTDTLAMVSSDTQAQALLSTIINNLALNETQTDNSQFNQSAIDNLSLSDTNTNQIDRGAIVNDNLGLSETESNETKFNQALSETLANEETTTGSIAFISNIEETIKGTESIGIITQFLSSVSDALAIIQELWGDWWTELSKHTTSWTQSSKNTTSYTQQSKNTTSWTQETKNKTNTKLG
jgi:hypothetical protein